jgi:hypothetical protein
MMTGIRMRTIGVAIMVVLTMIGLFAATKVPVVGPLLLSIAGLPAFVIILAWGGLWFLLYSALTITVTGILATPSTAFMMIPLIFMPAALLSATVKFGLTPLRAIGLTLMSATLFSTGLWTAAAGIDGSSKALQQVREQFEQQIVVVEEQLDKIQESGQGNQESVDAARENFRAMFEHTLMLIPVTFLFVWHLMTLGIFYIGALFFASRFGYEIKPFPNFTEWRFDWNLIWLYIAGWLMFHVIGEAETIPAHEVARLVGANCLAISNLLYYIAGLSLLFFMFDKYQIGSPARVGLSCLALVLAQAVVWFGIIDVWADFRTPKPALFVPDDSDDDF